LGRSLYVWQVNLASLLAVLFVAFVGFYFSSPFLPLLVRHLGVTDLRAVASLTGVIVAGGALAAALSANAASQLLRRWTHAQVLGVALLASACGSALMGFSQTALQFGVWRVVGLFAGGILTLAYGLGGVGHAGRAALERLWRPEQRGNDRLGRGAYSRRHAGGRQLARRLPVQ